MMRKIQLLHIDFNIYFEDQIFFWVNITHY
jgi:hypothetical protein